MRVEEMTPMKRMTHHFKKMESFVLMEKPFNVHRHETKLARKVSWNGIKEDCENGVNSDFVRIYMLENGNSVGFSFDFEKTHPATVFVTRVVAGMIITSRSFEEDDFRNLMNNFNRDLSSESHRHSNVNRKVTHNAFLGLISERFLSGSNGLDSFEIKNEIESARCDVEAIWREKENSVSNLSEDQRKKTNIAGRIRADVDDEISTSEDGLRLAQVKKQIEQMEQEARLLNSNIRKATIAKQIEKGLGQIASEIERADVEIKNVIKNTDEKIRLRLEMLPLKARTEIKSKLI